MSKNFAVTKGFIANPLVILGAIVFIWALSPFIVTFVSPKFVDDYGKFGDMFGAINSLFSGLALAGLVYSVYLQREDFNNQVKQMERQVDQMELQVNVMQRQNFDSLFFRRLELYKETREALFGLGGEAGSFDNLKNNLKEKLAESGCDNADISDSDLVEYIINSYNDFYKFNKNVLGKYFRSFYYMLKFMKDNFDDSQFDTTRDHAALFDVFRSLLSDSELFLIFYNCIGKTEWVDGQKLSKCELRELVSESNIMKHMELADVPLAHRQIKDAMAMLGKT